MNGKEGFVMKTGHWIFVILASLFILAIACDTETQQPETAVPTRRPTPTAEQLPAVTASPTAEKLEAPRATAPPATASPTTEQLPAPPPTLLPTPTPEQLEPPPPPPPLKARLSIEPLSGPIGTEYTIELRMFHPNEVVDLDFMFTETGVIVLSSQLVVDADGYGRTTIFSEPGDESGRYLVFARGQSGSYVEGFFEVE